MAYSNNPNMAAIVKWAARAPADGRLLIPTRSSRPKSHPKILDPSVVQAISLKVALRAQTKASFSFAMMQTDNGPEFSKYFHDILKSRDIALRHTRVRLSNDNAHIERFNRDDPGRVLGWLPDQGPGQPSPIKGLFGLLQYRPETHGN